MRSSLSEKQCTGSCVCFRRDLRAVAVLINKTRTHAARDLERTFGSYAARPKAARAQRGAHCRNNMQLATGSDLTTSRLGQPHEGVIGARVAKRVAYRPPRMQSRGTEMFWRCFTRAYANFHVNHIPKDRPPPPPTSNRCRTPVARAHRDPAGRMLPFLAQEIVYITDVC